MKRLIALSGIICLSSSAMLPALELDWTTVSDEGNAADAGGLGAVGYQFRITKHETTNAQYAEFLNAVAKADPYQLYTPDMATDVRGGITRSGSSGSFVYTVKSGYANKPVVHVSIKDAQRFCNWIHNGFGTGSTETGAYTPGDNTVHTVDADVWLPTENEWYKAAYYQPAAQGGDTDGYWLHATRSNTQPTSATPPSTLVNAANYTYDDGIANGINGGRAVTQDMSSSSSINYLSDVGAYSASPSYYGTFDQAGNVWEWTEGFLSAGRVIRGASWIHVGVSISASGARSQAKGFDQLNNLGFRIASAVPGLPRAQSITFDPLASWTFDPDGNTFSVSATASSNLPVTFSIVSGPATVTGNTVTISGVGAVTVAAAQSGGVVGLREYAAADVVERTFSVTKGWQDLILPVLPDLATSSPPQMLSAVTSRGLPASFELLSGPAVLLGNQLTLTGLPGVVTIRASQLGNGLYHPATAVTRSFNVTVPGTQIITFATPANRFLSEAMATLSASASSGLPVSFEVVSGPASVVGSVLTMTSVGTVKVRATQSGDAEFKPAAAVERSFKILADPVVPTLLNLTQVYDGQPKPINTAGTTETVTITYGKDNSSTPPTGAGSYPVKVVVGNLTKTGTLVIQKALLTIIPADQERFSGVANPELTFSYSGFVAAETSAALSKFPVLKTTATLSSPSGDYPITASGAAALNYTFRYLPGRLRVISFAGKYEALVTDTNQQPAGKVEITIPAAASRFTGKLSASPEVSALPLNDALAPNLPTQSVTGSTITTRGDNAYEVAFAITLDGEFTGTVKLLGMPFGTLTQGRKLLSTTASTRVGHAGAYTMHLAPAAAVTTSQPFPAGSGHAVGNVDGKGTLNLTGRLADGTPWSVSAASDEAAGYRIFAQPYAKRMGSFVAAYIQLQAHPDLASAAVIPFSQGTVMKWKKAALATDKAYPGGFGLLNTICTVDAWLPPQTATKSTAAITMSERLGLSAPGNQWSVVHDGVSSSSAPQLPTLVTLSAKNAVSVVTPVTTPLNVTKWKVVLAPSSGAFSGSFELSDPAGKRPVKFYGTLRQPPSVDLRGLIGAGHFILPALPGAPSTEQTAGEIRFQLP